LQEAVLPKTLNPAVLADIARELQPRTAPKSQGEGSVPGLLIHRLIMSLNLIGLNLIGIRKLLEKMNSRSKFHKLK
jgi:hypothetical protein